MEKYQKPFFVNEETTQYSLPHGYCSRYPYFLVHTETDPLFRHRAGWVRKRKRSSPVFMPMVCTMDGTCSLIKPANIRITSGLFGIIHPYFTVGMKAYPKTNELQESCISEQNAVFTMPPRGDCTTLGTVAFTPTKNDSWWSAFSINQTSFAGFPPAMTSRRCPLLPLCTLLLSALC